MTGLIQEYDSTSSPPAEGTATIASSGFAGVGFVMLNNFHSTLPRSTHLCLVAILPGADAFEAVSSPGGEIYPLTSISNESFHLL